MGDAESGGAGLAPGLANEASVIQTNSPVTMDIFFMTITDY